MVSGWRYRATSSIGAGTLTVLAVWTANTGTLQRPLTTAVPVVSRLEPSILAGSDLIVSTLLTLAVTAVALSPLYEPRPRRILDTAGLALRRVLVAGLALSTIGYFDYTYRLPRPTLLLTVGTLSVVIPAWFVLVRRRPERPERAVVVGDDPEEMAETIAAVDVPVVGYVSPPSPYRAGEGVAAPSPGVADGGHVDLDGVDEVPYLGGLSRLEDVLLTEDVETAILAFAQSDRAEFFGALETCHEHGVDAEVPRRHADRVLTPTGDAVTDDLVGVDLEPWSPWTHLVKRAFDVVFAGVGLLALSPLIALVAVAIKLDSPGPVLYSQTRTAELGDTFTVYKFRSMLPDSEDAVPGDDEDRITTVGRVLRQTHIDEIPQLWSVLVGDMSVVGPRAVWVEEESLLEDEVADWRKRWFVKPGLTGLAQIHDVGSTNPTTKLRYDLEYIRRQSFWFDLKIVVRQVSMIFGDAVESPW